MTGVVLLVANGLAAWALGAAVGRFRPLDLDPGAAERARVVLFLGGLVLLLGAAAGCYVELSPWGRP